MRDLLGWEASKANCINRIFSIYGAGDGNRTHVRSLGSFYTAIVRRPLTLQLIDYTPTKRLVLRGPYFPYFPKLGKTLSFGKY